VLALNFFDAVGVQQVVPRNALKVELGVAEIVLAAENEADKCSLLQRPILNFAPRGKL
jgi:hypothetical protein